MSTVHHDERLAVLASRALDVPLTLITGGSGWGKSRLLALWTDQQQVLPVRRTGLDATPLAFGRRLLETIALRHPAVQVPAILDAPSGRGPDAGAVANDLAELVASAVSGALDTNLPQPLLLVVDELDELPVGVPETLLALARQAPRHLHLAAATRSTAQLRVARLRAEGRLFELTPADLAFTVDELMSELVDRVGDEAGVHADRLHHLTNGWPLAVELAISSLERTEPERWTSRIESLDLPGSPLVDLLVEEGLAELDSSSRRVLALADRVPRLNLRFLEAVGLDPLPRDLLVRLSEAGLFLATDPDEHGWYRSTGLGRTALSLDATAASIELPSPKHLADAYVASGHIEEALMVWTDQLTGADTGDLVAFVVDHADSLVERADPDRLHRLLDRLGTHGDPAISETIGQLSFRRGDWDRAVEAFEECERLSGSLPSRLATRLAQIRYLRGEIGPALTVCERAVLNQGDRAADAQLLAWWSSALWLRNDVDACAEKAEQAFAAATESRDNEALATAHTVLAMLAALRSDRSANDLHYLRALDHAKRAGDVMQIMRVRSNRGSRFIEEGLYAEALVELDQAIDLGETSGFGTMLTIALVNRGEAYHAMGRLDDAMRDLRSALDVAHRIGSLEAAYALLDLGLVHLDRGELRQARVALTDALEMAEPEGDLQAIVPALVGLARAALDDVAGGEDGGVVLARTLIDRALQGEASLDHPQALAVSAMVALAEGDRERASRDAEAAADIAATRRDRPSLAFAYEMQSLASDPPDPVVAERALGIWTEIGNSVGICRAMLVKARAVPGEGAALTRSAQVRAERIGARRLANEAEELHRELARAVHRGLEVRTFGSFSVLRDGEEVSTATWQSKKARDLFKMLLSRRPARLSRDQMIEALWPDEPIAKSQRKFSVALSTARSVLDPDKREAGDHYIVADQSSVGLRVENLRLDVEEFLAGSEEAEQLLRSGDTALALQEMERSAAIYRGQFLEEDLYEDWSIAMREQCRLRFVDLSRNLARLYRADGDIDRATSQWLRIIERDPYDEEAHLSVVELLSAKRRHGEARRAYRRYAAQMAELGIEAAAFPAE